MSILVTGACGNLGPKLIQALLEKQSDRKIIAVDLRPDFPSTLKHKNVSFVQADLTNPSDENWLEAVKKADTIIHFAAQNPYPDASWEDGSASFVMTHHLLNASERFGVGRFVFASSNHVLGGYKEKWDKTPGVLMSTTPPLPGTALKGLDGNYTTQLPYATAKVMGECCCREVTRRTNGKLATLSVRIGWCQPGENKPETISASGTPKMKGETLDPQAERDLLWFRSMWLSNRDFAELFTCAIQADPSLWPEKSVIINGVSNNDGMPWDLAAAERFIGYKPKDNLFQAVPK